MLNEESHGFDASGYSYIGYLSQYEHHYETDDFPWLYTQLNDRVNYVTTNNITTHMGQSTSKIYGDVTATEWGTKLDADFYNHINSEGSYNYQSPVDLLRLVRNMMNYFSTQLQVLQVCARDW